MVRNTRKNPDIHVPKHISDQQRWISPTGSRSKLVRSHQWWQAAATCSWCYWHLSAVSARPAQSAEKVFVSQRNTQQHWQTDGQSAGWMARGYTVWCNAGMFSALLLTAAWFIAATLCGVQSWIICNLYLEPFAACQDCCQKVNLMSFTCDHFIETGFR